jgi:hypothetical protein
MGIFNPQPILDRLPSDRQKLIVLAAAHGVDVRTVERFRKTPENIRLDSLNALLQMSGAPYREVFDEKFFTENNQN